jgi:hypothetical protein
MNDSLRDWSKRRRGSRIVGERERERVTRDREGEIYYKMMICSLHRWCGLTCDGPICGPIKGVPFWVK